jgi:cell division protein FtsI (penicillin-binding protein 3)
MRALPAINPGALMPLPQGPIKHALETAHNRLFFGAALFTAAFLTIAVRLAWVTLTPPEANASITRNPNHPLLARADIVDRNGIMLATSLSIASLYANPRQISDPKDVARQLAALFPDLNPSILESRLVGDKNFAWLKRDLTPKEEQAVNHLGIPGLYFQRETKRLYPQGNLTAHLAGFVDIDSHGLAGAEKSFDGLLTEGNKPLQLSVDLRLQHIVHEELAKAIADFDAVGGAGIVMDLRTAEVLALVSLPDFDPAVPGSASEDQRFNRATLGVYEMGSTFKIFNTAIALDSGVAHIHDVYDATSPIKIGGFTIDDYHGKHRPLSIPEIFTYSSNIGSAKMADKFGTERQQYYLQRFGLLTPSPVELPEVGKPLHPALKDWRRISTMTIAYGHGISVSPIQLVAAVAAIANDGIWHTPTIVKREAGELPPAGRVVSVATSQYMRELMRLVVQLGTGKKADVPGYLVGGKTGTADKQRGKSYDTNSRLASFTGIFPVSAPRYLVWMMVDEPKPNAQSHGYATAGWVAAPAIGNIVARMAPLYGLTPIPQTAVENNNPLAVGIADYDSAASKSRNSATKAAPIKSEVPIDAE